MNLMALMSPAEVSPLVTVVGMALLGGALALDDTALIQTWVYQPLPAGLLAGMVCGDPASGLGLGLLVQLLVLGNIPVGQSYPGEHVGAVVAGVGATALSGHSLPANPLAAVSSPEGLMGWLLLAVALLSLLGRWVVGAERKARLAWMLEGHLSLRDGFLGRFEQIHLRCLLATALRGMVLVLLWMLLLTQFWLPIYQDLPHWLTEALARLPLLVPALAVGLLVDRYGLRACWTYLVAGMGATLLVTRLLT